MTVLRNAFSDRLKLKRPVYYMPSKSQCGSYTAAMALAANVFTDIGEDDYARECLYHAIQVYNLSLTEIPNTSTTPDSHYYDHTEQDNLALGAVELYRVTGRLECLNEALRQAEAINSISWFSWGNLEGLACYRLAEHDSTNLKKLKLSLNRFRKISLENPFGFPLEYYNWGSASVQMGVATLAILYYQSTGDDEFLELAVRQRDFILGCNSHGVSFVNGFGSDYTRNFHHQVSFLTGKSLPGAFAEGLAAISEFNNTSIHRTNPDRFTDFQTEEALYFDDRNDYICNEPTIGSNAIALFVAAWFAEGRHYGKKH